MGSGLHDRVAVSVVMRSGNRHDGTIPEHCVGSLMRAVVTGDDSDANVGRIRTPDGELSFPPSAVETLLTPVDEGS